MRYRNALLIFVLSLVFCAVFLLPCLAYEETLVPERSWGSAGTGDGQFGISGTNGPMGIAVDSSENVYVADTYNDRIQVFDSNGTLIRKWGSRGSGNGQFKGPYGIAIDPSGNVYVVDSGNYRIQKFTSSGVHITQWGSRGLGNGQFNSPRGIAVDSSGNVYVTDYQEYVYNAYGVQKFDSNGTPLGKWGLSSRVRTGSGIEPRREGGPLINSGGAGVAVDSSDNVYVVDDSEIVKFNSAGGYLGTLGRATGTYLTGTGLGGSCYIALDPSGNIYSISNSPAPILQVIKHAPDGRRLFIYENPRLGMPFAIAFRAGKLYVTEYYGTLVRFHQEARGEVVVTTTTMPIAAAVGVTAALPPQYIISVHEGEKSEGIVRTVHADNLESLVSSMFPPIVPAGIEALGAPIENASVRVGRETFATGPNGRTPALILKEKDNLYVTKRGYKTLRITIPAKKYDDRFTGIVVKLKKQLSMTPSLPAQPIRTPVGP